MSLDPEIQQRFEQNAAAHKAAAAGIAGELRARKQEVAERAEATKAEFARLGKALVEVKDEQTPQPARRVVDNDISAKAEAYQEPEEDVPALATPPPMPTRTRKSDYEEEVPSFHWDEDPQEPPAPPPTPARPAVREKRPVRDVDEDLSEHDWLE